MPTISSVWTLNNLRYLLNLTMFVWLVVFLVLSHAFLGFEIIFERRWWIFSLVLHCHATFIYFYDTTIIYPANTGKTYLWQCNTNLKIHHLSYTEPPEYLLTKIRDKWPGVRIFRSHLYSLLNSLK